MKVSFLFVFYVTDVARVFYEMIHSDNILIFTNKRSTTLATTSSFLLFCSAMLFRHGEKGLMVDARRSHFAMIFVGSVEDQLCYWDIPTTSFTESSNDVVTICRTE